tara:strand:+ start:1177 stop:1389 length:213 start_codon:yes stop_codon:yes gene_type:complete
MFGSLYNKVRTRFKYFNNEPEVYEVIVEDNLDYTDEIEKALWDIKLSLDLPTEEVEIAVESRYKSLNNNR